MLDPFLLPIRPTKQRRSLAASQEQTAQMYGHSVDTASPHSNMGLWVGKLLIRMGEKLSKQDDELKHIKDN